MQLLIPKGSMEMVAFFYRDSMGGPHKGKGCQGNEASALTMVVMIFLAHRSGISLALFPNSSSTKS